MPFLRRFVPWFLWGLILVPAFPGTAQAALVFCNHTQGAIEAAFKHDGPAIIDVVTDPLELVMPPKVTLDQAKGFSVWMMKAVLNGQGNELVQLARSAWGR